MGESTWSLPLVSACIHGVHTHVHCHTCIPHTAKIKIINYENVVTASLTFIPFRNVSSPGAFA